MNDDLVTRRRKRIAHEAVGDLPPLSTVARVDATALVELRRPASTVLRERGLPAVGSAIWAVTGGQWSLLDVIREALNQTGPARLRVSAWTIGLDNAETLAAMLNKGLMTSLEVFVDASFPNREPEYAQRIVGLLGLGAITLTNTHAKFATIRNAGWNIGIEGSMNLNRNPRFENCNITHLLTVADMYDAVLDQLTATGMRMDTPRPEVSASFERLVGGSPLPEQARERGETNKERLARLIGERRAV